MTYAPKLNHPGPSMPGTSALIERLTELLGEATLAGELYQTDWMPRFVQQRGGHDFAFCETPEQAALIVAAVNELPGLLAEITRLSERVERAKGMLAEASEVLDRYSDASQEPGDSYPRPNAAMRMMHEINEELDRA